MPGGVDAAPDGERTACALGIGDIADRRAVQEVDVAEAEHIVVVELGQHATNRSESPSFSVPAASLPKVTLWLSAVQTPSWQCYHTQSLKARLSLFPDPDESDSCRMMEVRHVSTDTVAAGF
jgi:hypothetical protein